jgi:predicted  nucleic acid-binding Zn-ribbon protein
VQEAEILRLTAQAHENEVTFEEARKESISLRQDLEDARLEQHRLEDQLELRQEEIEQLNAQIRESQKSKLDAEKLAESEVPLSIFCKTLILSSNSAYLKRIK